MKLYYCYLSFTRPRCRNMEFTCKAVLIAPTFSRAREMYIERNKQNIKAYEGYKYFHINIVEQKDEYFLLR